MCFSMIFYTVHNNQYARYLCVSDYMWRLSILVSLAETDFNVYPTTVFFSSSKSPLSLFQTNQDCNHLLLQKGFFLQKGPTIRGTGCLKQLM